MFNRFVQLGLWMALGGISPALAADAGEVEPAVAADTAPACVLNTDSYLLADDAIAPVEDLLAAGDYKTARQMLSAALDRQPEREGIHALRLLLADLHRRTGQLDRAVELLDAVAQYPPLASLAAFDRAQVYLKRGDMEQAADSLDCIRPGSSFAYEARLLRAELHLKGGHYEDAVSDVKDALSEAADQGERHRAELVWGDALEAKGDVGNARELFERVWWSKGKAAAAALERLKSMGKSPGPRARLLRDLDHVTRYNVGKRKKALRKRIKAFKGVRNHGLRLLGEAMLLMNQRGKREKAIPLLGKALKRTKLSSELRPWVRLTQAVALRRLNRDLEAVEHYLALVDEAPESELVERALLGAGSLAMANGLPLEGERLLHELLKRFPMTAHRSEAVWQLGFGSFLGGDYDAAIESFNRLASVPLTERNRGAAPWAIQGLYWRARAEEKAGRVELAEGSFRTLVERYPLNYYGLLARGRLLALQPEAVPVVHVLAQPATVEQPVEGLKGLKLPCQRELSGAVELVRIGWKKRARRELRAGLLSGRIGGAGLSLLAALYQLDGNVRGARSALRRYGPVVGIPSDELGSLWSQAFPVEFEEEVTKFSQENDIPVELVLAIIRQESRFNPKAVSYAKAVGLMQVLPVVARKVASLLGVKRPRVRDLKKPTTNLKIGTRVTRELVDFFQGNVALALAGFNAGAYAVKRWLHQRGHLGTDEFVELIPYRGTGAYAKKVLTSALIYYALYTGPKERGEGEEDGAGQPSSQPIPASLLIPDTLPEALGKYLAPASQES